MKEVLPWLVRWARRAGTKDLCPVLAALVSPVQNIIFLATYYFTLIVPIALQSGQGRLSLNVCLQ